MPSILDAIPVPDATLEELAEAVEKREGRKGRKDVCMKDEVKEILVAFRDIFTNLYAAGIRVVADTESLSMDVVMRFLSLLAECAAANTELMTVTIHRPDGSIERRTFVIDYTPVNVKRELYESDEHIVLVPRVVPSINMFLQSYSDVIQDVKPSVITLFITPPGETPSFVGKVFNNLITDIVMSILYHRGDERFKYVGRLSFDILLTTDIEHIRWLASKVPDTPPAYSQRLREVFTPPFTNPDMIRFPAEFEEYVKKMADIIKDEEKFILLVAGETGSGRKSFAYKLAHLMDVPAYHVRLILFQSKYYQETELKIQRFFNDFTSRLALAAFDGLEYVFRVGTNVGDVVYSLRSMFRTCIIEAKRGYYVLVTGTNPPKMLLDEPLLSSIRIVVPLPDYDIRLWIAENTLRYRLDTLRSRKPRMMEKFDENIARIAKSYDMTVQEYLRERVASLIARELVGATPAEVITVTKNFTSDFVREVAIRGEEPDVSSMIRNLFNVDPSTIKSRAMAVHDAAQKFYFWPAIEVMNRVLEEIRRWM